MNFRKRASEMAQQVKARVQSQESDLNSQDPHKGGRKEGASESSSDLTMCY